MKPAQFFLDRLRDQAREAETAETAFRRDFAGRLAALETGRAVAYRRMNLVQAIADGLASAADEAGAVAAAAAIMRARLGWSDESEARAAVMAAFAPVARAMFQAVAEQNEDEDENEGAAPRDPAQALAEFESWYAANHPTSFWVLFENPLPETPVVDF
ncbi:MAG: hypothetical protein EPO23_02855 [Xanthobacteraceae bacterium]|nr:MAG: hypothetical protein EPO23_02855 [Xanthobacteraceae bacterium]